jgi:hypothetical protein
MADDRWFWNCKNHGLENWKTMQPLNEADFRSGTGVEDSALDRCEIPSVIGSGRCCISLFNLYGTNQ